MKAYQLLITLKDVEPKVWRRLLIPAETNFKRLHDTIQFAMGWQDYHLFEFRMEDVSTKLEIVGNDETYDEHVFQQLQYLKHPATGDEGEFEQRIRERIMSTDMRKAKGTRLPKYVEKHREMTYVYDYGDHWEHVIKLEKVVDDYPFGYPTILEGEGACPPEDVGGSGGYEEFLSAWEDSTHPDHESMKLWGESQGYQEFDIQHINKLMKDLLKLKKVK